MMVVIQLAFCKQMSLLVEVYPMSRRRVFWNRMNAPDPQKPSHYLWQSASIPFSRIIMRLVSEKEEETKNTHKITQLKELELVKQSFFLKVIKSHYSRGASSCQFEEQWTTIKKFKGTLEGCKWTIQVITALALKKSPTLYMTTSEQTAETTWDWIQDNSVQVKRSRIWKCNSGLLDYADYPNPSAYTTMNKVYFSVAPCCQKKCSEKPVWVISFQNGLGKEAEKCLGEA